MSIFNRLKSEIRYKNSTEYAQHHSNPIYGGGGKNDVVILPEKPKKKRKLMEVQSESKVTLKSTAAAVSRKSGRGGGSGGGIGAIADREKFEMDADDDEEMNGPGGKNEEEKTPTKVAWGPSEILEHLNQPQIVNNINYVITTLNKTEQEEEQERGGGNRVHKNMKPIETVWDHSESSIGKKSDNNFFLWFETMSAGEARKIMEKENLIYE